MRDRVLASNPEVSDAERSTWAEPDWEDWVHLSLQMPLPSTDGVAGDHDGEPKILDIEILRPQSWLREQIAFVVGSPNESIESELPQEAAVTGAQTLTSVSASSSPSRSYETAYVDKAAVPFSPLAGIYRELALTSALLAADGLELVGMTVEMDLGSVQLIVES